MSAVLRRNLAAAEVAAAGQFLLSANRLGRDSFADWAALVGAPAHIGNRLRRPAAKQLDDRTAEAGLFEVLAIRHGFLLLKGF